MSGVEHRDYLERYPDGYASSEAVCQRWLFQDWKIVEDTEAFLGNAAARKMRALRKRFDQCPHLGRKATG
jgi:hypothetical protein